MTYPNPLDLFDSILEEAFTPIVALSRNLAYQQDRIEWFEEDHHYYAQLDLPGVAKQDLEIEFENDTVALKINPSPDADNSGTYRLRIPESIEKESIEAALERGVLTLTLPKTPEKRPVTIEIA